MVKQEHWDSVYRSRETRDLGWYEPSPSTLNHVLRFSAPTDPVIDIGGGDSRMVDALLGAGYEDVTVLDVSTVALDRSQVRLGPTADSVRWIHADITEWEPTRTWTLWHDRAVFHFLTSEHDRRRYAAMARRAVAPGGHLVVAAFAPDGPEQCAGLPVERYDANTLAEVFRPHFELVESASVSGSGDGDRRPYTVAVLRSARESTDSRHRSGLEKRRRP